MRMAKTPNGHKGSPNNIYLSEHARDEGNRVAKERYDVSLSLLVEGLILREVELKKGLLKKGHVKRYEQIMKGGAK